ncbi:MAG: RICIN domain-containing protein [Lachnospiraceae bacterium]|nr:RICIN domain-containing protein [Lachnospiraceae bacterium]
MNKRIRFIVMLLLCVLISAISGMHNRVDASSSDVAGIDSGTIYYIKNTYNGKYLEVQNGTDANGTAVVVNNFTGTSAQKWRVEKKSDGYYRVFAVVSVSNRVLDRSSSAVDIWTYNSTYNSQKFTLIRDTSTGYYAGTYQIKNSNDYLIYNDGTVCFSASGSGSGALWSFEPVTKGDADFFSFYYPTGDGYFDTRDAASTFCSKCSSMGYNSHHFVNYSAANGANFLEYDSIWTFCGHGWCPGDVPHATICFKSESGGNNGYLTASSSIINGSLDVAISSMTSNKLANERCVLYIGCSTGISYNGYNLVDATFNKGAHFALGTNFTTLSGAASNWIKKFYEKANTGATIRQCVDYANYYQYIGGVYYRGDTFSKLK